MSFLNRFLYERPRDDLLQSVARNLEHLLSSRRRYGSPLVEFGVGEYLGEHGAPNTVRTLLKEIRDNIESFEPRMRLFDVRCTGHDTRLRLHIHVRGVLEEPRRPLTFHLLLLFHAPTGGIEIEVCDDP